MSAFVKELREVINRNSCENGSNTPDFILSCFLEDCLIAFDRAVKQRESWYGRKNTGVAELVQQPITQQGRFEDPTQISAFVGWVASLSKTEYAAHQQLVAVINQAQKLFTTAAVQH